MINIGCLLTLSCFTTLRPVVRLTLVELLCYLLIGVLTGNAWSRRILVLILDRRIIVPYPNRITTVGI